MANGDTVIGIRHRLEGAGFPLLPEVVVDVAEISHEAGHPLGHVGVEMTQAQNDALFEVMSRLPAGTWWLPGDCIGADSEAHGIAWV